MNFSLYTCQYARYARLLERRVSDAVRVFFCAIKTILLYLLQKTLIDFCFLSSL